MKIETKIAKEFCQTINWWLSAEELAEVVRLNAAETNPGVARALAEQYGGHLSQS